MKLYWKPSGRFGTVTAGIVKAASPGVCKMSQGQIYMHACLMLALGQCAQDILTDFINLPSIRGKYKAQKAQIASDFAQQRKKIMRGIPADEAARFEGILCGITDSCQARVKWLVATVRGELAQKVDYRVVEAGALLGIVHGIVQCCNRINQIITGRTNTEYNRILEEIALIDEKIGMPLLNDGVLPDADKCVASLMELVEDMKSSTIEAIGATRKEGSHEA